MKKRRPGLWIVVVACAAGVLALPGRHSVRAADWPTFRGDSHRNAVSEERLGWPLSPVWVHRPRHPPQPAWPPPAKQDFYHGGSNLAPRVDFDRAYHVAAAGDYLLYGSSAEHAVHCLDAATGQPRWSFYAEGPVRFAPSVQQGKVYFGSDDGNVYCLKSADGQLLWKYRAAAVDRRLPGNGHMISLGAVRTGLLVEGSTVYGGAGLFPEQDVYLFALDAETGKELWKRPISQPAQGYLAADAGTLWVPSGRAGAIAVRLQDGKGCGEADAWGTYLVATRGQLFCESSRYQRQLLIPGVGTQPAHFVAIQGETAYFQGPRETAAVTIAPYLQWGAELAKRLASQKRLTDEWKKVGKSDAVKTAALKSQLDALQGPIADLSDKLKNQCHRWRRKDSQAFSFAVAGDAMLCGRDGSIDAARTADGAEAWSAKVSGAAYGIAVAQGRLFVSTDEGLIYCFGPGRGDTPPTAAFPEPRSPYPQDDLEAAYARAAETIVGRLPVHKGFALVLDCGDGRLAFELARRSEFRIVGVEADAAKAAKTRELLAAAGLLGRVTVHHVAAGRLPYPKYFANLVVSDKAVISGTLPGNWPEIQRVLRPYGGVAMLGGTGLAAETAREWLRETPAADGQIVSDGGTWVMVYRGPLAGDGGWTHQYADAANTASSGDSLVRGKMEPLWFGDPGPRDMIDRHNRTMAPLMKDGRLFVPANERVIALDAYNGTRLWETAVPDSRRVGVMKDSAHMALADDCLYVAVADKCWGLNVGTGERSVVLQAPQPSSGEACHWGYLAVAGDRLFGTTQLPGASFREHCNMCPVLEGDFRPVVLGNGLFSLDRKTGDARWRHEAVILNSTVALGNGRVYFLESRDPAAAKASGGRARIDRFLGDANYLVALESQSGRRLWETAVKLPFQHIVYVCYVPPADAVLVSGTFNARIDNTPRVVYGLRALRADTGAALWQRDFPAGNPDGSHGEQWQHPVILGNEILSKYYRCELRTGNVLPPWNLGGGGGCGTLSASACTLFYRGGNPRMLDVRNGEVLPLNRVSRPGCFINIVPAGGIVAIPEASSGCTCNYPLQASFAYVPADEAR